MIHGGTGLRPDVVKKLIALGGAKFNVSTELKHVLTDSTYTHISEHRQEYNPWRIDLATRKVIMEKFEFRIDLLGSTGKA